MDDIRGLSPLDECWWDRINIVTEENYLFIYEKGFTQRDVIVRCECLQMKEDVADKSSEDFRTESEE